MGMLVKLEREGAAENMPKQVFIYFILPFVYFLHKSLHALVIEVKQGECQEVQEEEGGQVGAGQKRLHPGRRYEDDRGHLYVRSLRG